MTPANTLTKHLMLQESTYMTPANTPTKHIMLEEAHT
ncbi:hypothetical protein GDO81_029738 [Engystomops pustulosus]|uniref:Uncharacterized protein n=1 Tax=Engystomops pustulosus TaxID=76066 RepID=A0AAV6ZHK4_ENGPU|nr:hypothetical protein GDO81_029738 [Engystomops pustulosus]